MAIMGNTDRERRIMKLWAGGGIVIITAGLFMLNTTGAWQASGGNPWYTISVGGAEIVVAVAFGFTVLAQTWLRRIVCGLIFALLLVACIENGKLAIQQSFASVFVDSAEALEEKALVAEQQARELDAQKVDVRANAGADLSRVRDEIAELNLELALMGSSTRISEAQTRLKALGEYTGPIDGIRAELTEQAMLQRGETVRNRLGVLQERETNGAVITGVVAGADPAAEKRIEAIRLRTQANEVVYRTYWMHLILIALEGARSFGVWAFLMVSTVRKRDIDDAVSPDVPEGMVDLRMTEEEWAEYEAAMAVHSNIKDGAQKGARTRRRGKKIKEGAEYSRELVERFADRRRKGETMENILQTRGLSLGEFLATYDKYILDDDERELLLGEFDEAFEDEPADEDEPEMMANGHDYETDETDEGAKEDADVTDGTGTNPQS